jgi:membrane protein implicated in regulation of membrane protease activity
VITIDLANAIFLGCLAVGGILLLVTVLLGDIAGGVLDALNLDFDLGGVSFLPVLLGFVAMFGVGGLFGTQALDLGAAAASLVGAVTGAIGAGTVVLIFRSLRGQEAPGATATASLVDQEGQVSVGIEPGRYGAVIVNFDGAPLQRRATSDRAIPAGRRVRVTSVVGTDLVVEPVEPASSQV